MFKVAEEEQQAKPAHYSTDLHLEVIVVEELLIHGLCVSINGSEEHSETRGQNTQQCLEKSRVQSSLIETIHRYTKTNLKKCSRNLKCYLFVAAVLASSFMFLFQTRLPS